MTDLVTLLDQHARTQPDREALRAQGHAWTYRQLAEATARAAGALKARGIGPGDRVALLCFNTPGFVFALFGAWRLGATVVPVNHKLQAPEIEYMLSHSKARLCIFDAALRATVANVRKEVRAEVQWLATEQAADAGEGPDTATPSFDGLLAESQALQGGQPSQDGLAEILYTSGTTGRPKGCMHSHRNVFMSAMAVSVAMSLTRADRTLIAMPIWHSSPLNNWLLGTLLVGGTVVLQREYAPVSFVETLAAERITFTFGAPIAFLAPLSAVENISRYDLSRMRVWAYGGGPLGADMARKLIEAYRSENFVQVYGMTEAGPLGTSLHAEDAITKAGSIGCSGTPGVVLEVRHPDGRLCGAGEVGEIHLRSPAMMQGYLDDPVATGQAFDAEGWYRSGDLARLDEDGYMYVVDRLKDMIVTGGENVYSKEVEDAISAHPDVQDVAVVGQPHPEWGETVTALLVARPGRTLDESAMQAFLSARLARYKIPRIFQVRDALPRTPTGKLLKHVLRAEAHPETTPVQTGQPDVTT
ncbi:MAG: long-chain-fatty-acid--CoA ligase [Ottowia sp.]|uniref:class I adenylate-forming enzyme family protein n=1 Tax=Ottowia sp. TaxID=1898956 RepID=UPI003C734A97